MRIYPIEDIPDKDLLYVRVYASNINRVTKQPKPESFRNTPYNSNSKSLSSDWNKYAVSLDYCRDNLAQSKPHNYHLFYFFEFNVGKLRTFEVLPQIVEHSPTNINRAHSSITGEKETLTINEAELDIGIRRIGEWAEIFTSEELIRKCEQIKQLSKK